MGRNRDQRCPVEISVRHTSDQVGGARPQRGDADAGPHRQPAIHVRHERRPLLVPGEDEPDRARAERLHQLDVLLAGNPEHRRHALVLEGLNDELRDLHRTSAIPGSES